MAINRTLKRIETPKGQPGFLGQGHIARAVVSGGFSQTDPFIILMDDMLDKQDDAPAGGPHPHAGFETVTLLLDGEIGDEAHIMKKGDFQMMTAGSGIVHTETIEKKAKMRLLQLWLNLPARDRWTTPRVQDLPASNVPVFSKNGVGIKLYSGSLAGLKSPVQNHVPVIIADIQLAPDASTTLQIPANFNTFLYVLEGKLKVGEDSVELNQDQVGWLSITADESDSNLSLVAADKAARLVLYSGKPQGEPIVSHGPFIADTNEDILRLYKEFREGKMKHITAVPDKQKIRH
ncbi:MAG: pirin family protein [Sphingobacteriales bacterium]|nr:MAG: pirin family protein [Sphingobacteriales bacterium]